MASYEGITSYKVITDWIQLLFSYKINANQDILGIVKLTQLIELLDDEGTEFSQEMLKLNTFEAFDYNVNIYHQPPAAGDIFIDKNGKYYILVGQDCDIITRKNKNGNNAVTEFVSAEIATKDNIDKISFNLEYMSIDNFRKQESEETQRLQIKYSSRLFVDNTIVKLCCYNSEGKCQVKLNGSLEEEVADVLAPYLANTYNKLQDYFSAVKVLNENSPTEISTILKSNYSPRLIALNEYEMDCEDKIMDFKFHRICRLNRTYVLYLYKLFLEYRGRHPFDCINLTRHSSLEASVEGFDHIQLPFNVILSSNRNINRNSIKKLEWLIKPKELENLIREVYGKDVKFIEKELIVVNTNPFLIRCEDGSTIELIKRSNNRISIKFR